MLRGGMAENNLVAVLIVNDSPRLFYIDMEYYWLIGIAIWGNYLYHFFAHRGSGKQ